MKMPKGKSRHDTTLMSPGLPALYQLNTDRKYIDGNEKQVRRWTYGRTDRNKQNKVILLVGETGLGKTTIINTMINYLLGVKFEDEEFYQITEEEKNIDETKTQTSEITVYEVFVEENPTSLTIIDTPGYGNTEGYEKDGEISENLIKLFSAEDGIHYIDAVCFVMKASQNRLSGKELYIFHSVLSLFGKDIENNIVFLHTHSDGRCPTNVINAIKKAEIPCRRDGDNEPVHFLFNNRKKEEKDEEYEQLFKSSWEMGEKSTKELLMLLDEKNRTSLHMTLDVLKERRRLEACVSNLKERINERELKIKELTDIQEAMRQDKTEIDQCENYPFRVSQAVKEKFPTYDEWWWNRNATCCSVCQENCHESCWENHPSWCSVMKDNFCTKCTGKCHYSVHLRENKKYAICKKTVTMSFVDLKQEYERSEFDNKRKIEEKLNSDLEKNKNERSNLLQEAYISIVSLSKIALKTDSAFTLQHLDCLIPQLKEEGKDEWMKNLEDLRKTAEEQKNKGALHYVLNFSRQWNQFYNHVTGKNDCIQQ
ncbi:uncharacterized protein [Sinocyclocheilus grahami]|uniref:uncharacterized protein n=1 Tax=Sinocyclocheilus grahami TaxID=75366 RepID=UPI0007AC64AD|nr:PREDICTED: uncharacterized protein LOC107573983 [Sinocyclocheilus grahami]